MSTLGLDTSQWAAIARTGLFGPYARDGMTPGFPSLGSRRIRARMGIPYNRLVGKVGLARPAIVATGLLCRMLGSLKRRWQARSKGSDAEFPLVIGHEAEAELDLAYPFQAYFFLDNVRHAVNQAVAAADLTATAKLERPEGRAWTETIRVGINLSAPPISKSTKLLIHLLDRIVDDEPSAFRYTYRGIARLYLGQKRKAYRDFAKAAKCDPGYAPVHVVRGLAHLWLSVEYAPYMDLERAMKLDPRWPRTEILIPVRDSHGKAEDAAVKQFTQALELDPEYAPALVALASCLIGDEEYFLADGLLYRVLELKPAYVDAHYQRARAAMFTGSYTTARKAVDYAVELDPNGVDAHLLKSNILFLNNRHVEALQGLNLLVERFPDFTFNVKVRHHRGLVRQVCRELDKAEEDFSFLIAEQPHDMTAYMQRGLVRLLMDKYDEAMADFDAVIDFKSGDASPYLARGRAQFDRQLYAEAMEDLNKALLLAPLNMHVLHARAAVHAGLGNFDKAHSDLDKVLGQRPDNLDAKSLRGGLWVEQGEYEQAVPELEFVLSHNPADCRAICYLAVVHAHTGRTNAARKGFVRAFKQAAQQGDRIAMQLVREHYPEIDRKPRGSR